MEPFSVTTLLVAVVVVCAIACFIFSASDNDHKFPPGPRGLETLREMYVMMTSGKQPEVAAQWVGKYGDIVMMKVPLINMCHLFLNDPADARELFTGQATRDVTNSRQPNIYGLLKDTVTASSPEDSFWHKQRKLFYSSLKFYGEGYQSIETTIQSEVIRLVDTLQRTEGRDVSVKEIFLNSIINVLSILLTGQKAEAGSPVNLAMAEYIRTNHHALSVKFLLCARFFPFLLHVPGSQTKTTWDAVCAARHRLNQLVYFDVRKNHTPGKPRGLVDVWIDKMMNEESDWMTESHVLGLISDVVIGGNTTTSETLSSTFLYLLHHPDVTANIRAEVERVVGPCEKPGLEHRAACGYVEATIVESLRVTCITPLLVPHRVTADTTFRGFLIPKGTMVFTNLWRFQRSDKLWEDALTFRPERFLDEQGELIPATHPLRQQMLPFGVGKRSCPGESFARARLFLYVTTLLQHFDLLPPETEDLPPLTADSWTMGGFMVVRPYKCRFRKREV